MDTTFEMEGAEFLARRGYVQICLRSNILYYLMIDIDLMLQQQAKHYIC